MEVRRCLRQIAHLDRPLTAYEPHHRVVGVMAKRLPHNFEKWCRQVAPRDGAKEFAVIGQQGAVRRFAKGVRLFQYRIEHRREIARRGVNDTQYLGGRGLLVERLAGLGDQPRVLDRDDRLGGKIF